jgi:PIN domain nuclease of toxin-antitoxin system
MILLDTHVWVRWLASDINPLPAGMINSIETADQLAVSAISCWEVAWLVRRGRIEITQPLGQWTEWALGDSGVICLPVGREIAMLAANLPEHHRDPADRLIIATAVHHDAHLASLDTNFPAYQEIAARLVTQ